MGTERAELGPKKMMHSETNPVVGLGERWEAGENKSPSPPQPSLGEEGLKMQAGLEGLTDGAKLPAPIWEMGSGQLLTALAGAAPREPRRGGEEAGNIWRALQL